MRGERYQNAMAIILLVLVVAAVPLSLNLPGWWFLWTPMLAALAVLPAVFLHETDLATGLWSPVDVRDAVASTLQGTSLPLTSMPEALVARISPLSEVRIRWRVTDAGTVLSYDIRPTPAGWALLAAIVASVVGSPLAIALAVALGRQARRFTRTRTPVASAAFGAMSTRSPSDEVRTLLVGSLSSGLRMAEQAYDAQRNAYTDAQVLAILGGFVLWMVLLVGLFLALNGVNLETGRWEIPIVVATSAAFLTGAGLLVALRRRYRPRLSRYRTWVGRLGDAMGREMGRTTAEPSAASTFELLVEASTQVPDWLDAQRKAGLSADPGIALLFLFLTSFCASMIIKAASAILFGALSSASIWASLAAISAGIAAWLWRRWRRAEDARLAASRSTWDAHVRALRARMDRFLEEI